MNTIATSTAPISGLLSLVAGALEPAITTTPTDPSGQTPTSTQTPTPTPDLSTVLGQLAGGWMALNEDGHGWMLLQFTPHPATQAPTRTTADHQATTRTTTDHQPTESHPVPTRPDFGARARRVHTALTDRERQVLCLVAGGATNSAIGRHLFISPKTASVHVSRILTKLDATTRTEAAALAHASGLVRPWHDDQPTPQPRPTLQAVGA